MKIRVKESEIQQESVFQFIVGIYMLLSRNCEVHEEEEEEELNEKKQRNYSINEGEKSSAK